MAPRGDIKTFRWTPNAFALTLPMARKPRKYPVLGANDMNPDPMQRTDALDAETSGHLAESTDTDTPEALRRVYGDDAQFSTVGHAHAATRPGTSRPCCRPILWSRRELYRSETRPRRPWPANGPNLRESLARGHRDAPTQPPGSPPLLSGHSRPSPDRRRSRRLP